MDRYSDFQEAAESILDQTYDSVELVIVVDGTDEVYNQVQLDYGDHSGIKIHCNSQNRGLSYSRNIGAEIATGDIVAFMDDDATASSDWAEHIIGGYERHNALAVGGRMLPDWVAGKPEHLPEEFYFLIGVTYRGFPEEEGYVRNTFSSNLSFKKQTFLSLGGFKTEMGKRGENDLQGGETELCVRLEHETGEQVVYIPEATVSHKIYNYRTDRRWLLERAFWQGYSKRRLGETNSGSTESEQEYLSILLTRFFPDRVCQLIKSPSLKRVDKLVMLFSLTFMVGLGYFYALLAR